MGVWFVAEHKLRRRFVSTSGIDCNECSSAATCEFIKYWKDFLWQGTTQRQVDIGTKMLKNSLKEVIKRKLIARHTDAHPDLFIRMRDNLDIFIHRDGSLEGQKGVRISQGKSIKRFDIVANYFRFCRLTR